MCGTQISSQATDRATLARLIFEEKLEQEREKEREKDNFLIEIVPLFQCSIQQA